MVSQEVDVIGSISVAENVFLGDEPTRGRLIEWRSMRQATEDLCRRLNLSLDPDAVVDSLSPAGKQMVQVLRAIRRQARLVVFDEPTSSLGGVEKANLLRLVRQLADDGVAVIYVSHHLDEVFEIGDRVAVLKDGALVATHDTADIDAEHLVREMVGRDASAFYSRDTDRKLGEVGMRAEGYVGPGVHGADLEIRHGEILGLGGLVGAGRSELADLLFGAAHRTAGRLLIDGVDVTPDSPAQAIESGIVMLTEDRQQTGLLRGSSIATNVALARSERGRFVLNGEADLAARTIETLRIAARGTDQDVATLSGGNQQKVLLGRWLAIDGAKLFILDEPTKGVDIGAKNEIYRLIEDLAAQGAMVLVITSDLPELLSLPDRITVMRAGRVTTTLPAAEATEETLMKEFIGATAA